MRTHSMLVVVIFGVLLHYCAALTSMRYDLSVLLKDGYFRHANYVLKECAKSHGANDGEMIQTLINNYNQRMYDDEPDYYKCAWDCFFKKMNVIDKKGMYNPIVLKENLSVHIDNLEDRRMLLAIAEDCKSVNDHPESGCDRSLLLAKCAVKDLLQH